MESGKAELGTLLVSVGYLKQSSVIDVDIIQGEKFPGLEKTNVKYLINGGTFGYDDNNSKCWWPYPLTFYQLQLKKIEY